ncbi:MAG TPA: hypothetical protein VFF67_10225 [Thermoplasmata archaeon]|nr:hypothetical protein [Thermoplasmata archaeon]
MAAQWNLEESAAAQIQSLQQEVIGLIAVMFALFAFELTLAAYVAASNPPRTFPAMLAAGALGIADSMIFLSLLAVMSRYDLIFALVLEFRPWKPPLEAIGSLDSHGGLKFASTWFRFESAVFYGARVLDKSSPGRHPPFDVARFRHLLVLTIAIGALAALAGFILVRCAPFPPLW